mmetsp:Transcript_28440/g.51683  ORF Transcript_28440/g.51683 Transcript_28440/m.51683 type:complete len:581 (-) Transcript_28440:133-1875(-)
MAVVSSFNLLPNRSNSRAQLFEPTALPRLPPVADAHAEHVHQQQRPPRRAPAFVVNTAACNGKSAKDLYSLVAEELGWQEVDVRAQQVSKKPTIYCMTQTADMLQRMPLLGQRCWVSRYLAFPDLCDKGNFARMIIACKSFCNPGDFSFVPKTWVVPDHMSALRSEMANSKGTFIVKPEDGAQGDGIYLVKSDRDLTSKLAIRSNACAIVQRYIEKPLLLHGVKFDLRIYVCFIGGSDRAPPHVFLCREGLARFCTEAYEEPAASNMHKCMSHLTNYSLNKRSDKFEHSGTTAQEVYDLRSTASKRPLTVALKQMRQEYPGFDIGQFYENVSELVQKSAAIMAPLLASYHRGQGQSEMPCFQTLGFDVILDTKFVPFLLEINNNPSLCIDEALPLLPESTGPDEAVQSSPSRMRERGKTCRCMDMAQPHYHQTAMVDLIVKRTTMLGAFRLLQQITAGSAARDPSFLEISVEDVPAYDFLSRLEGFFHRCGGAAKAFTSGALRRNLGLACGHGRLQKLDLDTLSQKFRGSGRFAVRDAGAKCDALRVFEFLELLKNAAELAFPDERMETSLGRLLTVVGA